MRLSIKTLQKMADRLPPEKVRTMAYSYKGSRKVNAATPAQLFREVAELGFDAYGDCYYLEDAEQTALADILCQLIGEAGRIKVLSKNRQVYI